MLRCDNIKVLPPIKLFPTRNAMNVTQMFVGIVDSVLVYWACQGSVCAVLHEHYRLAIIGLTLGETMDRTEGQTVQEGSPQCLEDKGNGIRVLV